MLNIIKNDAALKTTKKSSGEIEVITHDGLFHSDEVFSVALLRLFYKDINLTRTRDKQLLAKAINDPDVYVLDVGEVYDPKYRNFDHHQKDAPEGLSTIALLFQSLFPKFSEEDVLTKVYVRLIDYVNRWDQGKENRHCIENALSLPMIISGFNRYDQPEQDYQFIKAVDFAYQILGNEIYVAMELNRSEKIWNQKQILGDSTVLLNKYCTFWRTIQGKKPQYHYIIQPDKNNWTVVSVNAETHPLPEAKANQEGLIFQHKDRFISVFDDFASTMKYVTKNLLPVKINY